MEIDGNGNSYKKMEIDGSRNNRCKNIQIGGNK